MIGNLPRALFALAVLVTTFVCSPAIAEESSIKSTLESSKCNRYFSIFEHKYRIPKNLISAISTQESGKWDKHLRKTVPWPWTINVKGKGFHFKSKREAIKKVKQFQAKGIKSIDIGCMQVNLRYHPEAFRTLEQAFEPRYNVEYAAKLLSSHYKHTKNWKKSTERYHAGRSFTTHGKRYANRVYSLRDTLNKKTNTHNVAIPFLSIKQAKDNTSLKVEGITKDVLDKFGKK